MAPYSMDLRERVVRAWDASGDAEEVAATFAVSRAISTNILDCRARVLVI
jgi:transposase